MLRNTSNCYCYMQTLLRFSERETILLEILKETFVKLYKETFCTFMRKSRYYTYS